MICFFNQIIIINNNKNTSLNIAIAHPKLVSKSVCNIEVVNRCQQSRLLKMCLNQISLLFCIEFVTVKTY